MTMPNRRTRHRHSRDKTTMMMERFQQTTLPAGMTRRKMDKKRVLDGNRSTMVVAVPSRIKQKAKKAYERLIWTRVKSLYVTKGRVRLIDFSSASINFLSKSNYLG